ncbi:hypothetical protein IV203_025629 [Nitzschia inconspicua]|uniref:Uncharacterized protein n=1 Tax=Nitzschia inconspicua TaxID=303405 RepID=A0A9K3PW82_9STRA|nr:hypothetical protein IV203_025629 [Nitzschia inconspicua]
MELTKTKFLEEANRSINTELQIFHATYPKVPVSKIKLHDHPSLLMPYFGSNCPPDDTRKEKVMDALRKLKDGSGNPLKYKDDVYWYLAEPYRQGLSIVARLRLQFDPYFQLFPYH